MTLTRLMRASPMDSLVLSPDELRTLTDQILALTTAETTRVIVWHEAVGVARVARGQVRLSDSGDSLTLLLQSQFGQRAGTELRINQIDAASLRHAVEYLERVASQMPGDPVQTKMPIPPRHYLPNTTWKESTVSAFGNERHAAVQTLVAPLVDAKLLAGAFVGVSVRSISYGDKQGLFSAGRETDSELNVTAWNADGKGSGWAGQAARDWTTQRPEAVSAEAARLTKLAANPVAFEPGRRLAILDRPAVAQIVAAMGQHFSARRAFSGMGPLFNHETGRVRLGERIFDPRVALSSDPNDPEGGFLPFSGPWPLVPMTWVEGGVLKHLAYDTSFAAEQGVTPAIDEVRSLRMSGGPTTVEEMIANCKEGIYVNRFSQIHDVDINSGTIRGYTTGACFLIRNGKIEKSVKHFRILESPWHLLNRLEAIGPAERTAFGYSPWHGGWPIPPTIVPPLMVSDFNFNGLADAV
jgi:predicted Zn-dependent protease